MRSVDSGEGVKDLRKCRTLREEGCEPGTPSVMIVKGSTDRERGKPETAEL